MEKYQKNIIPQIEAMYNSFTPLEKTIADFFIHSTEEEELSSKSVSARLYVSEASLSRFAKKCGYKGYREFIFHYKQGAVTSVKSTNDQTKQVLNTYQELLNKSYSLVNEQQIDRVVNILSGHKRIYVYGFGSSGLAGMEMQFRFMRLGVDITAVTDSHMMKMNSVILSDDCVVLGISVSGKTQEVTDALREAKRRGAVTLLITSNKNPEFKYFCDELLLIPVKASLNNGKVISPQFPIQIMVDILYSHFLESDKFTREALHEYTLNILDK